MKRKVYLHEEPWKMAREKLQGEKLALLNWKPPPVADVIRGTSNNPDIGSTAITRDASAAYAHALKWAITVKPALAEKAIEILNAWSSTLQSGIWPPDSSVSLDQSTPSKENRLVRKAG